MTDNYCRCTCAVLCHAPACLLLCLNLDNHSHLSLCSQAIKPTSRHLLPLCLCQPFMPRLHTHSPATSFFATVGFPALLPSSPLIWFSCSSEYDHVPRLLGSLPPLRLGDILETGEWLPSILMCASYAAQVIVSKLGLNECVPNPMCSFLGPQTKPFQIVPAESKRWAISILWRNGFWKGRNDCQKPWLPVMAERSFSRFQRNKGRGYRPGMKMSCSTDVKVKTMSVKQQVWVIYQYRTEH